MTISLKASADGLSGAIQVGGVDKVTIGGTGITAGVAPASITNTELATAVKPLGVGQTWQNMLGVGGRALSTPITNGTGRPIEVIIGVGTSGTSTSTLTVDGIVVSNISATAASASQVIHKATVPAGGVYTITNSAGGLGSWSELR